MDCSGEPKLIACSIKSREPFPAMVQERRDERSRARETLPCQREGANWKTAPWKRQGNGFSPRAFRKFFQKELPRAALSTP